MKKFISKLIIPIIAILLMLSFASVSFADDPSGLVNYLDFIDVKNPPEITAEGAYLIEAKTGAVLYRKNSNEQFFPASITKIMTALLVIENCDLDEMVTFSHDAVYKMEEGGYSYIAEVGDQLTVRDCLYALLLMSSNEAAHALAEHVAGTIEDFAVMMNERAEELGATNTHFVTPHGLTNPEHLTTPHDMACIMKAAIDNSTFLQIDSTVTYKAAATTTNPDGYFCTMRHSMMRNTEFYDERVIAGKTGYISAAKNTLVTYAQTNGLDLIAVVMRVDGTGQACKDTKALIDYAERTFEIRDLTIDVADEEIAEVVKNETGREYDYSEYEPAVSELFSIDEALTFDHKIILNDDIQKNNRMTGVIKYGLGADIEKELGEIPISIKLVPLPTEPPTESYIGNIPEKEVANSFVIVVVIVIAVFLLIIGIVLFLSISRQRSRYARHHKSRKKK